MARTIPLIRGIVLLALHRWTCYYPPHMINAEVQKSGAESALSVIRKFTRRVQGTGLVKSVRDRRYYARAVSKTTQKKRALKRIKRTENYRELLKEGKVIEAPRRGRSFRDPGTAAQSQQQQSQAPAPRSSGLGESTPIAR